LQLEVINVGEIGGAEQRYPF